MKGNVMMRSNEKNGFASAFAEAALIIAATCLLTSAIFTLPGQAFADEGSITATVLDDTTANYASADGQQQSADGEDEQEAVDSSSSDQDSTQKTESNTTYNYEYNYESTTETSYEYLYNNVEYKVVEVPHDDGMRDDVHQCTGYILPDSSSRIYSRSELECLSNWELYLARNEMYARHGRGFVRSDLQSYFNSCSWYTRQYDPAYYDANFSLSSTEMANAETMKDIEYSRNSPYVS